MSSKCFLQYSVLCIIILQLRICMPTKLALESYRQSAKPFTATLPGNTRDDNCYGGKLPLHGIDFVPCCLSSFLGRFFQAQDREQLCWEPSLVAAEGQGSAGSCGIAATPATRGGHQWPTPAAFHSSFEAGVERGFKKLGATALEWGNGSINWCNISIYWFKSSLFFCLAFVF